jgi:tetratricopeptide (TPR) repeat protein
MLRAPPPVPAERVELAEARLRQLVAEQPRHAPSHAALAVALDGRAYLRPELAIELRQEAAHHAAQAQRLDSTLPEPYLVQAAAACRENLWERCLALYRRATELAPSEMRAQFQYAMALASLGYLAQAEQVMRRGARRDPLNQGWHFGHGRILDTQGRHREAFVELQRAGRFGRYGRWFNAAWRGDHAALPVIAAGIGGPDDTASRLYGPQLRQSYLLASRALADPSFWPQARVAMAEFEQRTGLMNFLRALDPQRDTAAVIDGLDQVRRRSYSSWDLLLWTRDLEYLREDPAFQDYLHRNGIAAYWDKHGLPTQCRRDAHRYRCR